MAILHAARRVNSRLASQATLASPRALLRELQQRQGADNAIGDEIGLANAIKAGAGGSEAGDRSGPAPLIRVIKSEACPESRPVSPALLAGLICSTLHAGTGVQHVVHTRGSHDEHIFAWHRMCAQRLPAPAAVHAHDTRSARTPAMHGVDLDVSCRELRLDAGVKFALAVPLPAIVDPAKVRCAEVCAGSSCAANWGPAAGSRKVPEAQVHTASHHADSCGTVCAPISSTTCTTARAPTCSQLEWHPVTAGIAGVAACGGRRCWPGAAA